MEDAQLESKLRHDIAFAVTSAQSLSDSTKLIPRAETVCDSDIASLISKLTTKTKNYHIIRYFYLYSRILLLRLFAPLKYFIESLEISHGWRIYRIMNSNFETINARESIAIVYKHSETKLPSRVKVVFFVFLRSQTILNVSLVSSEQRRQITWKWNHITDLFTLGSSWFFSHYHIFKK